MSDRHFSLFKFCRRGTGNGHLRPRFVELAVVVKRLRNRNGENAGVRRRQGAARRARQPTEKGCTSALEQRSKGALLVLCREKTEKGSLQKSTATKEIHHRFAVEFAAICCFCTYQTHPLPLISFGDVYFGKNSYAANHRIYTEGPCMAP